MADEPRHLRLVGDLPAADTLEIAARTDELAARRDPVEILLSTRDYLREQALRLPEFDVWREAFMGIARDLDLAVQIDAGEGTR